MVDPAAAPPGSLRRRAVLTSLGAAAALPLVNIARAQGTKTLQVWTGQSSREQQRAFEAMGRDFEAANPGVKVVFQTVADDDVWTKLLAAFAGGEPPDLCFNLNPVIAVSLRAKGLLEPLNDVAAAVEGLDPRMLSTFNDKGEQFAVGIVRTVISTMWVRTDLLQQAGLATPVYWDDQIVAAQKMTGKGERGIALPYGKTVFGNIVVDMFLRQAGGDIVAPDGKPAFNGPGTIRALEFLKELRPYAPSGANSYGFGETLNAFTSGAVGLGMYTGRTVAEIDSHNPSLRDKIAAAPYVYPKDGKAWWSSSYLPLFINKGPKVNVREAKAFAVSFFQPKNYIDFLHGAPGHGLPVVASIRTSPAYLDNPILKTYASEIDVIEQIAAKAWTNIKPSDEHPIQFRMGDIYGANVLSGAMQRVIVNGESPVAVAAWGQDQIAQILKS